jgi:hypothetical protein
MSVGPLVTGPKVQGEDAAFRRLDPLENVGHEAQVLVVTHEPRVAVDDHHPDVAVLRHQRAQFAAVAPYGPVAAGDVDDERSARQALRHRGQGAGVDLRLERRRLLGVRREDAEERNREGREQGARLSFHADSL